MKNNKGFTLAEVLIALTVLGIVASLTIPSVIQKQREAANRTKIKKAMTVYDRMFAKMIIENNLKSDKAVRDFVKTDCSNTASYLKIAKNLSTENSCTFKTSDGVFWNIKDIFHPIISLNKDDLDDLTSKNTFQMMTLFDPISGAFRTNDLQYEIANDGDEEEMEKFFTFVYKTGNAGGSDDDSKNQVCDNSDSLCKAARGDYDSPCPASSTNWLSCTTPDLTYYEGNKPITQYAVYDENGQRQGEFYKDDDGSKVYTSIKNFNGRSSATISDTSTCKNCWYTQSISECNQCKPENDCHVYEP